MHFLSQKSVFCIIAFLYFYQSFFTLLNKKFGESQKVYNTQVIKIKVAIFYNTQVIKIKVAIFHLAYCTNYLN